MRADRSCRISICGELSKSLQIPRRLALPVLEDDIGERNTMDWPEPSHVVRWSGSDN
jgi:hypothetical protein